MVYVWEISGIPKSFHRGPVRGMRGRLLAFAKAFTGSFLDFRNGYGSPAINQTIKAYATATNNKIQVWTYYIINNDNAINNNKF